MRNLEKDNERQKIVTNEKIMSYIYKNASVVEFIMYPEMSKDNPIPYLLIGIFLSGWGFLYVGTVWENK